MIPLLDRALENLLRRDIKLTADRYDISFDLPSKEWHGKISTTKQTINIFMYHLCDNSTSNRNPWEPAVDLYGNYVLDNPPARLDLFYIISCWSPAQQDSSADEHILLSSVLGCLYKYSFLEPRFFEEELQELSRGFKVPIITGSPLVYKSEGIATNFWSALDQQLRPFIHVQVTVPARMVRYWIFKKREQEKEYEPLRKPGVKWKEGEMGEQG